MPLKDKAKKVYDGKRNRITTSDFDEIIYRGRSAGSSGYLVLIIGRASISKKYYYWILGTHSYQGFEPTKLREDLNNFLPKLKDSIMNDLRHIKALNFNS